MNRKLAAGLILLMICMFPALCHAREETEQEVFRSGDWEYCLNEDGTAMITNWNGEEESLAIPEELDGRKVTEIGTTAFYAATGLRDVTIPDSVTGIGPSAFYECGSLTGVSIPDSVLEIDDYAFCLCGSLKDVTIPDSVLRIGKMAFTASAIADITIPASVEEIGRWAFGSCHGLTDIEVSPENENFQVMDHALVETASKTLIAYPEGLTDQEYAIPDGILKIGDSAFSYCDNLVRIAIPDGVTEIGEHAFSSCRHLTDVNLPDSVERIGTCAFLNCKSLPKITVPDSVIMIGENAFDDCRNLVLTAGKDSYAAQYAKENELELVTVMN